MCSPRCIVGMEVSYGSVISKYNTYKYHSDWRSSHRMNSFETWELVAIVSNDLGMVTSGSDRLLTSASRIRVNFVCTGKLNTLFLICYTVQQEYMSKLMSTSLDIYSVIRSGVYLHCWWYLLSNIYKIGSAIIKLCCIQWWITVILTMILVPYLWFILKLQQSEIYVIYSAIRICDSATWCDWCNF